MNKKMISNLSTEFQVCVLHYLKIIMNSYEEIV